MALGLVLPCALLALAAVASGGTGDAGMLLLMLGMPWNILLTWDPTPETKMITTAIGVLLNAAVLWAMGFGVLSWIAADNRRNAERRS